MGYEIPDDLSIPDFLKVSKRKKTEWKATDTKVVTEKPRPFYIPRSYTIEEWNELKKTSPLSPVETTKKQRKPVVNIDTTGMRWDQRKGKWVPDKFSHLATEPKIEKVKKVSVKKSNNAPVKTSFGIPEGTNRDKLAKAMVAKLGTMLALQEWSILVYGERKDAACSRVMDGFIADLRKRNLPFEIIKDKSEDGSFVFGLFKMES